VLRAALTFKLKPVLQERIAAKMRQKLPQSASPVDSATAPPSSSTMNPNVQRNSQEFPLEFGGGVGSSIDDEASSAAAPVGGRHWQSHSASDHELSRAVFGGGSQATDRSVSSSASSAAAAPPAHIAALASDAVVHHVTNKEPGSARTEPREAKEAGVGSVPLSLLEFRRLTAGGLPNAATRVFVVTGRGLAGPIRVTQITQVSGF
jgi:hypothetical protein